MGLRDFLARHISRDVNVYRVDDFSIDPPEVIPIKKRVDVARMKPEISCTASKPYDLDEMTERLKARAVNVKLAGKKLTAKSYRIKRYVKEDVKTHRHKLQGRPKVSRMTKQIQSVPLELPNVIKSMKKRPESLRNEAVLACYGPIVEGGVLKLALNKQRGTLLVWYKPGSRQLKAKYVYLIRRLGLGGKPEWRWE